MTEELFKTIKELKDSIDSLQYKLNTIETLLISNNLSCKVEGVSDCQFKVTRYMNIDDENSIKLLLETQKQNLKNNLIFLQEKFSNI